MKYIGKVATAHYVLKNNREFYDVECPLEGDVLERAIEVAALSDEVNKYLGQVYALLRQGADPKNVEIPECLKKDELSQDEPAPEQEQPDSEVSSSDNSESN